MPQDNFMILIVASLKQNGMKDCRINTRNASFSVLGDQFAKIMYPKS
jgi:hypothetical protein